VNQFGKEWKQTIIQLQDYSNHISHHPEFAHMFNDFGKVAQSPDTVHDCESDRVEGIKEVNSLRADLLAVG